MLRELLLMVIMVSTCFGVNRSITNTELSHRQIRRIIESDSGSTYRTQFSENLLHIAVGTGDRELIREVDSLYPRLRRQSDIRHFNPTYRAVEMGDTALISFMDSLCVNLHFSNNGPRNRNSRIYNSHALQLMSEMVNQSDSLSYQNMYSHLINILIRDTTDRFKKWDKDLLGEHLRNVPSYHYYRFKEGGKDIAAEAILRYADHCTNHNKYRWILDAAQISNVSSEQKRIKSLSFLKLLTIPHTPELNPVSPLWQTIRNRGDDTITAQFMIDNGEPLNDYSVFDGELRSLYTYALMYGDHGTARLLKGTGHISERWFELQLPDFFPSYPSRTDTNWTTVTVDTTGKAHCSTGELPTEMLTVQTENYITQQSPLTPYHLFSVRSNRVIDSIETVTISPIELTTDTTISFHGNGYKISAPFQEENHWNYFTITTDSVSQVVNTANTVRVLWAGDIDSDQRLDLIVSPKGDYRGYYEYQQYTLLLSSLASPNELVGKADECFLFGSHGGFQNRYEWKPFPQHKREIN